MGTLATHGCCGCANEITEDNTKNETKQSRQSYQNFDPRSHARTEHEKKTHDQTQTNGIDIAPPPVQHTIRKCSRSHAYRVRDTTHQQKQPELVPPLVPIKDIKLTSSSIEIATEVATANTTEPDDIVMDIFADSTIRIHDVETLETLIDDQPITTDVQSEETSTQQSEHTPSFVDDDEPQPIGDDELQLHLDIASDDTKSESEGTPPPHNLTLDVMDTNSLRIIREANEDKTVKKTSSMRIQVEQLPQFKENYSWILDKNRSAESPASNRSSLKAYSYNTELFRKKRVTLTNTHHFLWLTSIIQGASKAAEIESEITRVALDKMLNLLPVPYRDKIWELCNTDEDTFIVVEEFEEFVDSLLIATGQYIVNMDDDEMFELRDMSKIFGEIVSVNNIFLRKKCVAKTVSKHVDSLSTFGATRVVMLLRNLQEEKEIEPNDIAIPLLTGFTKKAIKHSMKYCTRLFWKILTDVWWDEDDDEDMALPVDIEQYAREKHRHSRKRSKITDDLKRHLSQTSMDDLFGRLKFDRQISIEETDDEDSYLANDHNFLTI
eukprot:29604_1